MASFEPEQLNLIAVTKEVRVETRSGDRVYRTVIWVAVQDGTIFVRSVRGPAGRWYQRALADPDIALKVGRTRILARAVPATDATSVELASAGFRAKYPRSRSLDSMMRPETLPTTLRLDPRS
ncbi:MAG: DUF2255 family protein [Acidimicrobiia bacterium]